MTRYVRSRMEEVFGDENWERMEEKMRKKTYRNYLALFIMGICVMWGMSIKGAVKVILSEAKEDMAKQAVSELGGQNGEESITEDLVDGLTYACLLGESFANYMESLRDEFSRDSLQAVLEGLLGAKGYEDKRLRHVVIKYSNRLLRVHKGKYSGIITDVSREVGNRAYVSVGGKDSMVRFIAEVDEATTPMCRSLDGQLFWVNKENVYRRYSALDGGEVTYRSFGLVQGENLPPINNHFHWCRSTVTYLIDEDFSLVAEFNQMRKLIPAELPETFDEYRELSKDWRYHKRMKYLESLQRRLK